MVILYIISLALSLLASGTFLYMLCDDWRKYRPPNQGDAVMCILTFIAAFIPILNTAVAVLLIMILVLSALDGTITIPLPRRRRPEQP